MSLPHDHRAAALIIAECIAYDINNEVFNGIVPQRIFIIPSHHKDFETSILEDIVKSRSLTIQHAAVRFKQFASYSANMADRL